MLLGTLFRELFRRGVTLVATSNVPPSALYEGGLQRERFLPAIAAIETHCQVMELEGAEDFRLRILDETEIYHAPLDRQAEANLASYFEKISCNGGKAKQKLMLCGRPIATLRLANGSLVCFRRVVRRTAEPERLPGAGAGLPHDPGLWRAGDGCSG